MYLATHMLSKYCVLTSWIINISYNCNTFSWKFYRSSMFFFFVSFTSNIDFLLNFSNINFIFFVSSRQFILHRSSKIQCAVRRYFIVFSRLLLVFLYIIFVYSNNLYSDVVYGAESWVDGVYAILNGVENVHCTKQTQLNIMHNVCSTYTYRSDLPPPPHKYIFHPACTTLQHQNHKILCMFGIIDILTIPTCTENVLCYGVVCVHYCIL